MLLPSRGLTILTGKRNATIEFRQVRHVVHKHELRELTMTRTLSKASRLYEFIIFVYQACWLIYMNILTAVLLRNLFEILHVAFLLLVSIFAWWVK